MSFFNTEISKLNQEYKEIISYLIVEEGVLH